MTNTEKKQAEIAKMLETKITEYGFTFEYTRFSGWLPSVIRHCDDYISITIYDDGKYLPDSNDYSHTIKARASVCHMNPNSDTNELFRAAEQIKRGAKLVNAINGLQAGFTETYLEEYIGEVVKNDGTGLGSFLSDKYESGSMRHDGNFVFSADTKDGKTLTVTTEPVDGESAEIRITGIQIIG